MATKTQQRPPVGPVDTLVQAVGAMSLNHSHPHQQQQQQTVAVSPTATVNDADTDHEKRDSLSNNGTIAVTHQSPGDVVDIQEGATDAQHPASDLDTVKFFYNLGMDYFRLCVRVPPPNLLNGQTAVQIPAAGQRVSALAASKFSTAWNSHHHQQQMTMTSVPQNVVDRSLYIDQGQLTTKFNDASKSMTRRTSNHALNEKDDDLLSAAEKSRQAAVKYVTSQNYGEDDDETDGEELALTTKKNGASGTSKKEGSVSSVNSSTDVEVQSWSTVSPIHSHESQDSGWLSDVSSPTSTGSPCGSCSPSHGAGCSADQQLSDAAECDVEVRRNSVDGLELQLYSATENVKKEEAGIGNEDKTAGATRSQIDEAGKSLEKYTQQPSVRVPRYVRPVKEIPIRFRRLLEAEADRVARLCRRLQGSPIVCHVQQQQQQQEVGRMISQDSIVLLANPEAAGKATESFYGLQSAPYFADQQQQQSCSVLPVACNYQPCFDASVTAPSPACTVYHQQPYHSVAQPTASIQEFSPTAVSTWSDVVPAAALQPSVQVAMTADAQPQTSAAVHSDVIPNSFSHNSTYQLNGCSVPTYIYCPSAAVDFNKLADQSASFYYVESTFRPNCDVEMNGNIPCQQQQQQQVPTRPTPINHAGMCFYPAAAPQSSTFSHQVPSYLPAGGFVHVPVPPYCSQLPVQ